MIIYHNPFVAAGVAALAQISLQAWLIRVDWFQPDAPELVPGAEVCITATGEWGTVLHQEGDSDCWRVRMKRLGVRRVDQMAEPCALLSLRRHSPQHWSEISEGFVDEEE